MLNITTDNLYVAVAISLYLIINIMRIHTRVNRSIQDVPLYKCVKDNHGFKAVKTVRHYVNTA